MCLFKKERPDAEKVKSYLIDSIQPVKGTQKNPILLIGIKIEE